MSANCAILCVPKGGISDSLCQINKCWNHCRNTSRDLFIADQWSDGLMGLMGSFIHILPHADGAPAVKFISHLDSTDFTSLQAYSSTYPEALHQRLDLVEHARYIGNIRNYAIPISETKLVIANCSMVDNKHFAFKDLLVHVACGRGNLSNDFASRIRLRQSSKNILQSTIGSTDSDLGVDFIGIHVRNTDNTLKLDWKQFIQGVLAENPQERILICSDDRHVIDYCLKLDKNFYTVGGKVPFLRHNQQQLHSLEYTKNHSEKIDFLAKSFIDLIFLSRAKKIYAPKAHPWGDKFSGFTKLANSLRCVGNDLLRQ